MFSNLGSLRTRGSLLLLLVLLLLAAVMMPVSIRPAAYNQKNSPYSSNSKTGGASGDDENSSDNNNKGESVLSEDDSPIVNTPKGVKDSILNLYVVFHQHLDISLFEGLTLPDALPDKSKVGSRLKTGSLLDVVLGGNNDVTFLATNKDVVKEYNETNPIFRHRIVKEWETQGFQKKTGDEYGSVFNEFGAMASIFYSQYTYRNWEKQNEFKTIDFTDTQGLRHRFMLRNGLEDAFIGVLQYDMRLNDRVIRMLRRKIQRTRKKAHHLPPPAPRWDRNPLFSGQNRAVRLSPMHKQKQQEKEEEEKKNKSKKNKNKKKECCVFYSVSYPMQFLLKPESELTAKLLRLYNLHFFKDYKYEDLAKFAILDAFVIPFYEFNRLVPFLENLMRNGIRNGALLRKEARAESLKELEAALALFLGLLGNDGGYEYVMMPLRHEGAKN